MHGSNCTPHAQVKSRTPLPSYDVTATRCPLTRCPLGKAHKSQVPSGHQPPPPTHLITDLQVQADLICTAELAQQVTVVGLPLTDGRVQGHNHQGVGGGTLRENPDTHDAGVADLEVIGLWRYEEIEKN